MAKIKKGEYIENGKRTAQFNHIKAWKTRKKLINYKAIANNGETIFPSGNQAFSNRAGFHKNLRAIAKLFDSTTGHVIEILWTASPKSKTILSREQLNVTL